MNGICEIELKFDCEENLFYFDEFKLVLHKLKTFLMDFFIRNNETLQYHSLVFLFMEKQEEYISALKKIKLTNLNCVVLKYITQIWLTNITSLNKTRLNGQILFFGFWDTLVVKYNNHPNNIISHDGNEACNIGLSLHLMYICILHIISMIRNHYGQEELVKYLFDLKETFRLGIIQNNTDIVIEQYIFLRDKSFYLNLNYSLPLCEFFKVDAHMNTKKQIQFNIKLMLPWLIECFRLKLLELNFLNEEISFTQLMLNLCEIQNIHEKIEQSYRYYLRDIKQIKENLITMMMKYGKDDNINISKRTLSKPRHRKFKSDV